MKLRFYLSQKTRKQKSETDTSWGIKADPQEEARFASISKLNKGASVYFEERGFAVR